MASYTVESPIRIKVSANKYFNLNLNQYRNAHYFTLNTAKVNYSTLMVPLLKHIPYLGNVTLTYSLYLKGKKRRDVNNILTIVDKFLADCLVTAGILSDDDYSHLDYSVFRFGGFTDRESYVTINIEEVCNDMRITLTTEEIIAIVSAHLNDKMNIATTPENSKLEVVNDDKVLFHVDTGMIAVAATPKVTSKVTEPEKPKAVVAEVPAKVEPAPVAKEEPEPEPEAVHTATQTQEEVPPPAQPTKTKKLFGAIKV